jgi:dienelactone hydrolase
VSDHRPHNPHRRFDRFPRALEQQTRRVRLAGVPALIAHPNWHTPAPVMLWMHGRTVSKELDPGRYLRWIRAGITAVALDLPGHGERFDPRLQHPDATLEVVERMITEIDPVIDALAEPALGEALDLERMGIGGMSAGGMATLRRLCDGHDFLAASVEQTSGWIEPLFRPRTADHMRGSDEFEQRLSRIDPVRHLRGWRPLPIQVLSTTTDEYVPYDAVAGFLDRLKAHYAALGASADMIEHRAWSNTGAPREHAGFGRFANDAKNAQVEFLVRHLRPEPHPPPDLV